MPFVCAVLQLVLDCWNTDDWSGISGYPVKFAIGLVSVLFDVVFIIQVRRAGRDHTDSAPLTPVRRECLSRSYRRSITVSAAVVLICVSPECDVSFVEFPSHASLFARLARCILSGWTIYPILRRSKPFWHLMGFFFFFSSIRI